MVIERGGGGSGVAQGTFLLIIAVRIEVDEGVRGVRASRDQVFPVGVNHMSFS